LGAAEFYKFSYNGHGCYAGEPEKRFITGFKPIKISHCESIKMPDHRPIILGLLFHKKYC